MRISSAAVQNLSSYRKVIGLATMRRTMNVDRVQDKQQLQTRQPENKTGEDAAGINNRGVKNSARSHLGNNIDVRV